jgi:hypothetical protein
LQITVNFIRKVNGVVKESGSLTVLDVNSELLFHISEKNAKILRTLSSAQRFCRWESWAILTKLCQEAEGDYGVFGGEDSPRQNHNVFAGVEQKKKKKLKK